MYRPESYLREPSQIEYNSLGHLRMYERRPHFAKWRKQSLHH